MNYSMNKQTSMDRMLARPRDRVATSPRRIVWMTALLAAPLMALAQTAPIPPTVSSIVFTPATIASGGTSTLSIALGNANATAVTLTAPLTDALPAGLTVASAGGGSCPNAPIAAAGGGTLSYPTGATIPSGGCTITLSVKATSTSSKTYYTDTIPAGALQTNDGNSPAAASATLTVLVAVTVPNVVGLTQSQATTALQAAGLVLGAVTHAQGPTGIPFNDVFAQNPVAAASVAGGSAVGITISTGPGKATNLNRPLTSVANFVEPAQVSVASALERVCAQLQTPGEALDAGQRGLLANCLAIEGTYGGGANPAGLKTALDAISGKTATAQESTGVQFAGTQFTNIGARLAQLRQGTAGASFADLNLGVPALAALQPLAALLKDMSGLADAAAGGGSGDSEGGTSFLSRLGFFVNGDLRRGTQDTTDLETGFDVRQNSLTAGVDYRIANSLVLGLALGHASGTTDFAADNGRLNGNSNSASLYGTFYEQDLYLDFIATYGHIAYRATRTSTFAIDPNTNLTPANCIAGQCSIDTTGSTSARQLAFAASVGYGFHAGGLAFGPDIALDYTGIRVNGFTEADPNETGLALAYDPESGDSFLLKAGGNASYAISTRIAVILPEVRANFVHEFANNQRTLTAHFLDDPTSGAPGGPISSFVVFTDQPDRNYFDWAAGVSAKFPYGISAFIDYSAIGGESEIRTSDLAFGVRIQYGY
jgi:outer membrane lipase/esterase